MIKKLEKYFSQFTNKELEDNFSELVRKYNEKQKSEQRNVDSAFFYPIKVGSSVLFEASFQDYKNDIDRRISEGVETQTIRDFYQKKVIDKFLSDKRLFEIYEKIKVGEPIKNPPFSNIVKKWSFWSNVHRVQDIIELENFLKELPLQPETDKPDETYKTQLLFKVGLLFAKGEVNKYFTVNSKNKTVMNNGFTAPKIARELGNESYNKYILATINNYTPDNPNGRKNIFNSFDMMSKIIAHCESENITVDDYFKSRLPTEPI